jgi:hypothetical protein
MSDLVNLHSSVATVLDQSDRAQTILEKQRESLGVPKELHGVDVIYLSLHYQGHPEIAKKEQSAELTPETARSVIENIQGLMSRSNEQYGSNIPVNASTAFRATLDRGFNFAVIYLPALNELGKSVTNEPSVIMALDFANYSIASERILSFLQNKFPEVNLESNPNEIPHHREVHLPSNDKK